MYIFKIYKHSFKKKNKIKTQYKITNTQDPLARFDKKLDGRTSIIIGDCAIWDTPEVLGVLSYIAMGVACQEGEVLVFV